MNPTFASQIFATNEKHRFVTSNMEAFGRDQERRNQADTKGYRDLITRPALREHSHQDQRTKDPNAGKITREERRLTREQFLESQNRKNTEADKLRQLKLSQQKAYKQDLDNQIKDSVVKQPGDKSGLTGLNIGSRRNVDERGLARAWDQQLDEKAQRVQSARLLKEKERKDIEDRFKNPLPKTNRKEVMDQYRSELDHQRQEKFNIQPKDSRIGPSNLSLKFEPDRKHCKEKYKKDLEGQVKAKNQREHENRQISQKEDVDRIERYKQSDFRSPIENQTSAEYKTELDAQNALKKAHQRDLDNAEREAIKNSTGLNIGNYHPDYRQELKEALNAQIQEKALKEGAKAYRNNQNHEDRAFREKMTLLAQQELKSDGQNLTYKQELDQQLASQKAQKQLEKDLDNAVDNTGLKIGNYHPSYQNHLKAMLDEQTLYKKTIELAEKQAELKADQSRLNLLKKSADFNNDDLNGGENPHLRELQAQIAMNEALKALPTDEGTKTSLDIDNYKQYDRQKYKAEQLKQIEEVKHRKLLSQLEERAVDEKNSKLNAYSADLYNQDYLASLSGADRQTFLDSLKAQIEAKRLEQAANNDNSTRFEGLDLKSERKFDYKKLSKEAYATEMQRLKAKLDSGNNLTENELLGAGWVLQNEENLVGLEKQLAEDLKQQIADRQNRERAEKELSRKEGYGEGLPLGKYKPEYAAHLKEILDTQLKEKEDLKAQEKAVELKNEQANNKLLLRYLEENPDLPPNYLKALQEQIAHNKQISDLESLRENQPYLTGLPIGSYIPPDKKALLEGLSAQLKEKEEARLKAIQEAKIPSGFYANLEEEENTPSGNPFLDELLSQIRQDRKRAYDEKMADKLPSQGLNLGNYHPDYAEELSAVLKQQISEKELARMESKKADREAGRISFPLELSETDPVEDKAKILEAKHWEIQDIAKRAGVSTEGFEGYQKSQFRDFLLDQIASKSLSNDEKDRKELLKLSSLARNLSIDPEVLSHDQITTKLKLKGLVLEDKKNYLDKKREKKDFEKYTDKLMIEGLVNQENQRKAQEQSIKKVIFRLI